MDCQPPPPQAGKALLKRSLEPTADLQTSSASAEQPTARLRSNRADAAPQQPCNLDALPDDLYRRVLDTLSPKGVSAAAATCKRFATAWRHAAGTPAPLFPGLSREGCTRLRQFASDAYGGGDDLSTEAGAQNILVKKLPGRVYSQVQSQSCFDLFCGALGGCWLDGVELKVCHHGSSAQHLDNAVAFWGLAGNFPRIGVLDKDMGAHVAESVIY